MKRPPSPMELLMRVRSQVTWRRVVLVVVLAMNLRTFQYFPGGRPVEEGWFVLCMLTFATVYPLFKAREDWRFSKLEFYLLSMMIVLAIMPAITSNLVFGQPLIYGLLARRSTVLVATWLLLIQVWRRRWVHSQDVEAVLLWLTWFTCFLYLGMRLFLNPLNFTDAPAGFLLGAGTETQVFAVPGNFLPFGIMYYALRGIRERKTKYYLYAVFIFGVAAGSSWRFLFVSLSASILFFLIRWRGIKAASFALARFAVVLLIVGTVLEFVKPEAITDTVEHFAAAVNVTLGGAKQEVDPSSDARVEEVNIALPYVKAHPVFGVGELSGQWLTGPGEILGGYFHDSDIGLLGTLFIYGATGLLLAMYQFVLAVKSARKTHFHVPNALFDASMGYLFFAAIFSITTEFFVASFEATSFFLVVLWLISRDAHEAQEVGPGAGQLADANTWERDLQLT